MNWLIILLSVFIQKIYCFEWMYVDGSPSANTYGNCKSEWNHERPSCPVGTSTSQLGDNAIILVGGCYYGNDVWTFDSSSMEWTYFRGGCDQLGEYGVAKGVWTANGEPKSRFGHNVMSYSEDEIFIYGGTYYWALGGEMSDMKFSVSKNEWMWVSGENVRSEPVTVDKGYYSSGALAGARYGATSLLIEEKIYVLFGRNSDPDYDSLYDYYNLIFGMDLTSNQWAWLGGQKPSAVEWGTTGVYSMNNAPPRRYYTAAWVKNLNEIQFFGGNYHHKDLWEFRISDGAMRFIGGAKEDLGNYDSVYEVARQYGPSDRNYPGDTYGSGFAKLSGDEVFLFGGTKINANKNEVWLYRISTNEFMYVSGSERTPSIIDLAGEFTDRNHPGSRFFPSACKIGDGTVILLGGIDRDSGSSNDEVYLEDFWMFRVCNSEICSEDTFRHCEGTECVCNDYYYKNPTGDCVTCPIEHCLRCHNYETCLDCDDGTYKKNGETECVATCGDGFSIVGDKCLRCNDENCAFCEEDFNICSQCMDGYHLSDKLCIPCTDVNCASCPNSVNECLECKKNQGYYLNAGLFECLLCQAQYCLDCTSDSDGLSCVNCANGYYLSRDTCYAICSPPCGHNATCVAGECFCDEKFASTNPESGCEPVCSDPYCHQFAKCVYRNGPKWKNNACVCKHGYYGDGVRRCSSKSATGFAIFSSILGTILCFAIFVSLVVTIIIVYFYRRKTKEINDLREFLLGSNNELSDKFLLSERQSLGLDMLRKFRIDPTEMYITRKVLGSGGSSGSLFEARWLGKKVAVKLYEYFHVKANESRIEELERELSMMMQLQHPNIIQFYGVFVNVKKLGIVMDLCEMGDLKTYIVKNSSSSSRGVVTLGLKQKIQWIKEICLAMMYIHGKEIIHRDLKPQNCLLNDVLSILITDFGLSRLNDPSTEMTFQIGTARYVAPEVTKGQAYSFTCDVFSFSITLFEVMFENFNPYGTNARTREISFRVANDSTFRPQIIEEERQNRVPKWIIDLMRCNWKHDPSERMDFKEICGVLENMTAEVLEKPLVIYLSGSKDDIQGEDFSLEERSLKALKEVALKKRSDFTKIEMIGESMTKTIECEDDILFIENDSFLMLS